MNNELKMPHKSGYPWKTALVGALLILAFPWVFALVDSFSPTGSLYVLVALVVTNPVVFIIGSVRSWVRYGWKSVLTVAVYAAAFLISMFWTFNTSAMIYLWVYLALAALSIGVAAAIMTLSKKRSLEASQRKGKAEIDRPTEGVPDIG